MALTKQLSDAKDFCGGCGLCCMHMRTPPFTGQTDPRWKDLSQELRAEIHDWIMSEPSPRYQLMVKHDGDINPCIWLDLVSGKCKHYELRPDICRDYEPGCDPCRKLRRSVGLTVKGMPVVYES
jgi:Fe-S-cluster containining protein